MTQDLTLSERQQFVQSLQDIVKLLKGMEEKLNKGEQSDVGPRSRCDKFFTPQIQSVSIQDWP
jgi:hypothetical protein